MARSESSLCKLCLVVSMILNLYCGVNLYVGRRGVWRWNKWSSDEVNNQGLSWSRRAAAEAESAAALECSGHGRAYLDGVVVDGGPVCECNTCYGGPDCSLFLPSCSANADGGDPLFLEPFWKQHAEGSAVVVAGWHRMSYSFIDQTTLSMELESLLRKLHSQVGNAVTDGKYILFGAGSTQLLNAAVRALSPDNSSLPASVLASIPYYALYQMQTEFFNSAGCSFQGDTVQWKNATNTTGDIIEFVTAPNNPDGQLNEAVLHGPYVKAIYDRAYYWPHFTGIPSPADEDLTIFTISKLTGHAGSRFGWALIRNEEVYQKMGMYLQLNTMGVSRDTQLRALKLLKVLAKDGGREIFEFGYKTMTKRWDRLKKTLFMSNRLSLQKVPPENCTYFQKVREPTPAYAWVKCEREEDRNCTEILNAAKIKGRGGSVFHDDDRYVRLSLIRSDDDFDMLISRLERLLSEEGGAKAM